MPLITQNDFLDPLFSLNPFAVALIIFVLGWGNLFLVAVKTRSLRLFLRNPGFMVGDLLLLPHFLFYWFVVYVLMGFFIRGTFQLTTPQSVILHVAYFGVFATVAAHLTLPFAFGRKTFPRKNHQN